jgi:type VI secretion system ImpC/EvpB family protein
VNAARQDVFVAVDRYIAAIDARICEQVNAILHAPAFQRLEAGWRSLKYLADAADGTPLARIRVLSVSWNEVVRDLERASDFDQSLLFEKIYTQEFGTLGGEPFGLLVGNYEIQHRPRRPSRLSSWERRPACLSSPAFASWAGRSTCGACSGNSNTNAGRKCARAPT